MSEENTNNASGEGKVADSAASTEATKPAMKKAARPSRAKKSGSQTTETESVQFVGKSLRWNKKKAKQDIVPREAPAFIIDGRNKINLPKDLSKGAVVVDADTAQRVKTLFPADFKTPTAK